MFSKEDFNQDNATRLSVIIMTEMKRHPLTPFKDLPPSQKVKFNRLLNDYIQNLPDNWEPTLLADFNRIVSEDILNEDFDPSKIVVKDYNPEPELLLTDEQKDFLEKVKEEKQEDKIVY